MKRITVLLAISVLALAACSGSGASQPSISDLANALTTNQAVLLCQNLGGLTGNGEGAASYAEVVKITEGDGIPDAQAPAVLAYVVNHGCPQYANRLPK